MNLNTARGAAIVQPSRLFSRFADALGAADHGDQHAAVEQPLGHPLGVVERHRVDQGVAPLDIVDAEIVELHLHELRRDLGRGVEAEREGALEVGLRLGELLRGRALVGQHLDLAASR